MRLLVLPDLQVPDEDRKAVESVTRFIEDYQPDGLLCVGDELDSPEPSRWNKGYAGEFAGTLQRSIDRCHDVPRWLRQRTRPGQAVPPDEEQPWRPHSHVHRPLCASTGKPSCVGLRHPSGAWRSRYHLPLQAVRVRPGWMLAHGDEGSLIQTSGGTALGLAKKWGRSVVAGHTHKAAIQHHHLTVNGKATSLLFGMEVGHLMDVRKADYLKAGSSNWQAAIGLIEVDGRTVHPTLIPLFGSRVRWNGVTY